MIVGVGTDIVQIPRIEKIVYSNKNHFAKKILAVNELKNFFQLHDNICSSFLAKRFAAKEAVSKALGIGIGRGINFCDIEILNDKFGKPIVQINSNYLKKLPKLDIHLSLSDDYPVCVAFVVISTNVN